MKILTISFVLCVMSVLASAPATAGTIRGAYVGCLTESLLDEFVTAAVNNDTLQMQSLLSFGCIPINGMQFSLVDAGFFTSTIRVYTDGGSSLLYTVSEAVR